MNKDEGREAFYGMTMDAWKAQHQTEATGDKEEAFKTAFAENVTNKD